MSEYLVTCREELGRGFDVGVMAYDEKDARFAAKLRFAHCRRGFRVVNVERMGA